MDVLILETKNGGDINKIGNDLSIALGFDNMPYLAMFGGNPQASTPTIRVEGEQNFDWWGNDFETEKNVQLNSLTEKTLREIALNSQGRITLENAINTDLSFMKQFATINKSVTIINDNVCQIDIEIIEPTNLQNKQFRYIWDGSLQTLTLGGTEYVVPSTTKTFDETFDETFN